MGAQHHAALSLALTQKEGWRRFVEVPRSKPPTRPTLAEFKAMHAGDRAAFDEARRAHHGSFGPVKTPGMQRIHTALRTQVEANAHHPPGARPGTVIDGPAALGKSTILAHFGRQHEQRLRAHCRSELTESGDEFIPVAYVTLAAGTTVKGLNELIADFYALPVNGRATKVELTMLIQKLAQRCGTSLFLIDDIHYLKMSNQPDREVNDHLKHLASTIAATFVFAGIECQEGGLLREGRSAARTVFSQTGSRFSLLPVGRFEIETPAGGRQWFALLRAIERELVLLEAPEGMLSRSLPNYLFDRTHGQIGTLTSLVRQGAVLAIERGNERLTETLLDEVELSHDAESERQRKPARRRRARKPPAVG